MRIDMIANGKLSLLVHIYL